MENIINIQVKDRVGDVHNLELPTDMGLNLMEACRSYELPVEGVCGGMAMCASCHCYIITNHVSLDRGYDEQAMLDDVDDVQENSRLGCQVPITNELDGLLIELAPEIVSEESAFDQW